MMRQLITDLIPHAPQIGLYVDPNLPSDKLKNAIGEFGGAVGTSDVLVLYDATLLGSAKDGAVFTVDRLVFQNNDLEPVHEVRYADIVQVADRRKLIGGRRVVLTVNRGRATFDVQIDFSGRPKAAGYVARFLKEAMLRAEDEDSGTSTDAAAVRAALERLHQDGVLSRADLDAMLQVISGR